MRKIFVLSLVMCLSFAFAAGSSFVGVAQAADQYGDYGYGAYTPEQLDNLLAPVALYPDPLLAQLLIASTFPDQIQDAAGWVHQYGANPGIDSQYWDVSVKAVAHYPTVLFMMNDQLDWTTTLGQAYVNQSTDIMNSVQHLRQLARAEGNLISTPQQQVIVDGGYIEIVPSEPRYIFVPTYDAAVIYNRRVYTGSSFGGFYSFGSGFAIGAWLNYDLDWGSRRVVYDGWQGGGWRERSRPYVQVTNIYVNNRYQNVVVNRTVVNRQVNYQNVDRFNSVHNDVKFENRGRADNRPGNQPSNDANRNQRTMQPLQPGRPNMDNNRGRGQTQNPPAAPQPSPQVFRQNDNRNQRGQAQAPPATVQPSQPARPNMDSNRGRGQGQTPPTAPQQQSTQAPRQNNNADRGRQPSQTPPASVQKPAPNTQHENQPQGKGDHNNNKDNKDNRDH